MKFQFTAFLFFGHFFSFAQNQLYIPPALTGNQFQLNLQAGSTSFFPGISTNTMGVNSDLLGPTIILNQNDQVTLNVTNNLTDTSTIHWHGLHIAPEFDGGPHTFIVPGDTWSPSFKVLNKAGTNWYHPHLHSHTDEQVTKGISGMVLVRDAEESSIGLPMQYGIDEFPLILQTKGFDSNGQLLIHTNLDSCVLVNGTRNTSTVFPAQVVRLRVLNGSSQRVMLLGFSDNRSFYLIGTDGGLLQAPTSKNRIRLAPGQRADILLDLSTSENQNFSLISFGSELQNGFYGASQPGMGPGATNSLSGYNANPLNGTNFNLLTIHVGPQSINPIFTIPTNLANMNVLPETSAQITRNLTFTSTGGMNNLAGPYLINSTPFDMMTNNYSIPLDNVEIWSLTNQTPIAHPFHIHDIQFRILDINGIAPPPELSGLNDVVLVPGGMGTVRFIGQFSDFSNDSVPYMYHCHMLVHEDMGMMGQFIVKNLSASINNLVDSKWSIYPNPNNGIFKINEANTNSTYSIYNFQGQLIRTLSATSEIDIEFMNLNGIYFISDQDGNTQKLIIQN